MTLLVKLDCLNRRLYYGQNPLKNLLSSCDSLCDSVVQMLMKLWGCPPGISTLDSAEDRDLKIKPQSHWVQNSVEAHSAYIFYTLLYCFWNINKKNSWTGSCRRGLMDNKGTWHIGHISFLWNALNWGGNTFSCFSSDLPSMCIVELPNNIITIIVLILQTCLMKCQSRKVSVRYSIKALCSQSPWWINLPSASSAC